MRIRKYIFGLALFLPIFLYAQDTNFVTRHIFNSPVRNVFKAVNSVYAKTGDGLYKWEAEKWILQKTRFEMPYVFYDSGFFEARYIPNQYVVNVQAMAYLIPQRSLTSPTMVQLNDRLFVSVGGALFEYSVNKYYEHLYKEISIRDIYFEKDLKVISTYSGIYINDTLNDSGPGYSSGSFCKVQGKYYLCNDELYSFVKPSAFQKIESGVNVFAGLCRKLVEFNGAIYTQNTKSINRLDSAFVLTPIHQGYEYNDLEKADNVLLFCTNTGEVFQYDGKDCKLLFDVNSRVRDIYNFRNVIYFSTDKGVYTIQNMQISTLSLLANLPFSVKVVVDVNNNIWIATENGLYILPEKKNTPVPFIPGVEFNRGALTYYNDHIYAGSISGLYVIDIYSVLRDYLPLYLNKKSIVEDEQVKQQLFSLAIIAILLIVCGFASNYSRHHKTAPIIPQQNAPHSLTLAKIEEDIKNHNLMTVEGLAEFYETNPVQLNRLFKTFDTTPGKFMKRVKLKFAEEMLKSGKSMDEVVAMVGYSAIYLKKELLL